MFDIIVAVDSNNGIGKYDKETNQFKLPWPRNKTDLKFFADTTTKTTNPELINLIIMGRNTFESLPKILPKRLHIVISSKPKNYFPNHERLIICSSFELALEKANQLEKENKIENSFVIGGGMVYRHALKSNQLRYIYLNRFSKSYDCNINFPNESLGRLINKTIVSPDLVMEKYHKAV